uniref:GB1/RHD3-type G domain-containing protein n=1 Tax=Chelonoidis abingdonii TaxID=106734 RepID=A0A8C0HBN2_CHEAB
MEYPPHPPLDGREITEDEYLENALKLKPGNSQRAQLYNLPRECIRQFFPARKCFVFIQPASRRDLARLEELQEAELEPEFREQVARFCHHVWEMSKPRTIPSGHVVTRAMLGNLAVTYVDAIRSGAVPCMESAVLALAQIEYSAAVGEAVAAYEEQLGWQAALPTESVQELLELHAQCEREALRAFMACAFKDDDRRFQGELMVWPLARPGGYGIAAPLRDGGGWGSPDPLPWVRPKPSPCLVGDPRCQAKGPGPISSPGCMWTGSHPCPIWALSWRIPCPACNPPLWLTPTPPVTPHPGSHLPCL